jgi:DNA-binding NarL/FixJ family response regulator
VSKLRALVAEDEDFTRALIVNALQTVDIEVVLETGSATYALKTATRMKVDAAVLDLNLGRGPTGLDLALGLRRNLPAIGIVFLTSYADPRLLGSNSTMAPYGSIYLQKSSIGDISKIKRGIERSVENAQIAASKSNVHIKNLGANNLLTDVQIEIVRMVANGMSNAEIAAVRQVTEKSIEQTLSRILKKTNIEMDDKKNRRVELALYYLRQTGVLNDEAV